MRLFLCSLYAFSFPVRNKASPLFFFLFCGGVPGARGPGHCRGPRSPPAAPAAPRPPSSASCRSHKLVMMMTKERKEREEKENKALQFATVHETGPLRWRSRQGHRQQKRRVPGGRARQQPLHCRPRAPPLPRPAGPAAAPGTGAQAATFSLLAVDDLAKAARSVPGAAVGHGAVLAAAAPGQGGCRGHLQRPRCVPAAPLAWFTFCLTADLCV